MNKCDENEEKKRLKIFPKKKENFSTHSREREITQSCRTRVHWIFVDEKIVQVYLRKFPKASPTHKQAAAAVKL